MGQDNLSNMLSTIKNASIVGKPFVEVVHTKQNEVVAKLLKDAGYLEGVKVFKESGSPFKKLHLDLKKDLISEVERISKPGRRVYQKSTSAAGNKKPGVLIVSTSRGVMTLKEAKKRKLGGELICRVF